MAGASSAAFSAEDMTDKKLMKVSGSVEGLVRNGSEFQERVAESLERLAAAIRRHEANAVGLTIESSVEVNTYLSHDVRIKVTIPLSDKSVVR
jgi:hypothetical protein